MGGNDLPQQGGLCSESASSIVVTLKDGILWEWPVDGHFQIF